MSRRGDEDLALALYRRQVPLADWAHEALSLASRMPDPGALVQALERRHPGGSGLDLTATMHKLVESRGRDVFPYVMRHLREVYRGILLSTGYDRMLDLARRNEW